MHLHARLGCGLWRRRRSEVDLAILIRDRHAEPHNGDNPDFPVNLAQPGRAIRMLNMRLEDRLCPVRHEVLDAVTDGPTSSLRLATARDRKALEYGPSQAVVGVAGRLR